MNFTIFGARGFVGGRLLSWLQSQQLSCWTPDRRDDVLGRPLGHVIYCSGVTTDFRWRPYDTVQAHVCNMMEILAKAQFESLLYLSSVRVYSGSEEACEEGPLRARPANPDDLYNISKLMGESLCCSSGRSTVRIARLANIYPDFSSDSFLSSIVREAVDSNRITLRTSMESERDYVSINDVVRLLPRIACSGRSAIYNVASGSNTNNRALTNAFHRLTGCTVEVCGDAPRISFPTISIRRIQQEFGFAPSSVLDDLPSVISEYRNIAQGHTT